MLNINANIVCEISQENLEFGANYSDVVMVKEKKKKRRRVETRLPCNISKLDQAGSKLPRYQLCAICLSKAAAKRSQQFNATYRNMLSAFGHRVATS